MWWYLCAECFIALHFTDFNYFKIICSTLILSRQFSKLSKAISPLFMLKYLKFKNHSVALAGVAQWIELWTGNQRVIGSIPSQATFLGCGPGPN